MTTSTKPDRPIFAYGDHAAGTAGAARVQTAVTVAIGSTYTFSIDDFDLFAEAGEPLVAVHIAGLERRGTLMLRSVPVNLNEVIARDEIEAGCLVFHPAHEEEEFAYDSFLFATHDGLQWSSSPASMNVQLVAAAGEEPAEPEVPFVPYTGPTALDGNVLTKEGATYSFKPTDFNFQGAEEDYAQVQCVTVDTGGTLRFDGVEVSTGQAIAVEDIDLDLFTYEPADPGKDGFEFKVHDGTSWSEPTYSMVIDVESFYYPPTASDSSVETEADTTYVFRLADFKYNDFDGDEMVRVKIAHTGMRGSIRLDGIPIDESQIVSRDEIERGGLEYAPAGKGDADSFRFRVHDGTMYSRDEYLMTMNVVGPVCEAPVSEAPAAVDPVRRDKPVAEAPRPAPSLRDASGVPASSKEPFASSHGSLDKNFIAELKANTPPLALPDLGGEEAPEPRDAAPAAKSQLQDALRHFELSVTTKEDTGYVFSARDLSPGSTPISAIQVTSVEMCGLVQLDGMAVIPGQRITKSELDAGRMTFIPAGTGKHKYFDFKVRHGLKWSVATCSMSVEVLPAYDHKRP